ncbi:MAG: AMP-binding protein, partial [Acidimicrobiales bacterium]
MRVDLEPLVPPPDSLLLRSHLVPPERTLVDTLVATATDHGAEPALDDGTAVLSYAALLAEVEAFAARLAQEGVGAGDRVGVRMASGTNDLYVAILGTLWAGAAYVPVDADDPQERAELVFSEAAVAVVVTDGPTLEVRLGR